MSCANLSRTGVRERPVWVCESPQPGSARGYLARKEPCVARECLAWRELARESAEANRRALTLVNCG